MILYPGQFVLGALLYLATLLVLKRDMRLAQATTYMPIKPQDEDSEEEEEEENPVVGSVQRDKIA